MSVRRMWAESVGGRRGVGGEDDEKWAWLFIAKDNKSSNHFVACPWLDQMWILDHWVL